MKPDLFLQKKLFSPGPTPVPWATKVAALDSDVYHRADDFYALFLDCCRLLQPIFGSTTLPLILTASGSGAMDAAVVNLTAEGDEVVAVVGGKFGERWRDLALAYKCRVHTLDISWGTAPSPEQIISTLKQAKAPKALFLQANETSTGVRNPLEDLLPAVRAQFPDCLIIVDAISSLCAHPLNMSKMNIDCVVAGSQKGFGMAPGLAFIALSERGWRSLSTRPRYYFDLARERKGQEKGRSAWTTAISLIQSLKASLDQIHGFGIDQVNAHHAWLAAATRAAIPALNLEFFPRGHFSDALTSIQVPSGVDGQELVAILKTRYGAIFSGGQDQLKGKIVRLAHLGFVNRFDILHGLAALEFALVDVGHKFPLGAGVAAAMNRLVQP